MSHPFPSSPFLPARSWYEYVARPLVSFWICRPLGPVFRPHLSLCCWHRHEPSWNVTSDPFILALAAPTRRSSPCMPHARIRSPYFRHMPPPSHDTSCGGRAQKRHPCPSSVSLTFPSTCRAVVPSAAAQEAHQLAVRPPLFCRLPPLLHVRVYEIGEMHGPVLLAHVFAWTNTANWFRCGCHSLSRYAISHLSDGPQPCHG